MSRREIAFLMIGVGLGLLVACTVAVSLMSHMFLLGVRSPLRTAMVFSIPVLLVLGGELVLLKNKRRM